MRGTNTTTQVVLIQSSSLPGPVQPTITNAGLNLTVVAASSARVRKRIKKKKGKRRERKQRGTN